MITSYEIVIRDATALSKIGWKFIIIDEGLLDKASAGSRAPVVADAVATTNGGGNSPPAIVLELFHDM